MTKQDVPIISQIPLTAEAREAMLHGLFGEDLPHYGELFIPDNAFYANSSGPKQAKHMLLALCHWLGIKPGYIGLEFELDNQSVPDGQRYTIYIESGVLWDEFLLGASLAHALTRYLIEERKQVFLPSADRMALLATGSVVFGLELIVMNGLSPAYGWLETLKYRLHKTPFQVGDFGRFFEANYDFLSHGFIKAHGINTALFQRTLTPWASKRLGIPNSPKPTHAVSEARHKILVNNVKFVGIAWVALLVIAVGSFALINRVHPQSAKTTAAQERANLLSRLTQECNDTLAYQRQYADLTDIQTVRNLNSVSLRCQSINNQYQAAQSSLQDL